MEVFLHGSFSDSQLLQTKNETLTAAANVFYWLCGQSLHRLSGMSVIPENSVMSSATENYLFISRFLLCCITIRTSLLADWVLYIFHVRKHYVCVYFWVFIDISKSVSLIFKTSIIHTFPCPNGSLFSRHSIETLCYKPEGRGFDSRWGHWFF
jgi:hypothetical protein